MSDKMKTTKLIAAFSVGLVLMGGRYAMADSVTWILPTPYLSEDDSPWASAEDMEYFYLEDFEDGLTNTPGLTINGGFIRGPEDSRAVDSVDGDDGVIDGWCDGGHAYMATNHGESVTVRLAFDAHELGGLPTYAGLVWTDGNPDATVTVEAFDFMGASIGSFEVVLGDGQHGGSTAADRLLGMEFTGGIAAMTITTSFGSLEIDHIQYGMAPIVVPLPAPVGMGLAGLGLVAVARRRGRAA